MLSGSTVEVKETMARFTTDVIASCAFGINANSLKDPDSEFGRHTRALGKFSIQKGLAALLAFFAPYLNTIFRLKFVGDKTENYIRQIVWDTVHYR
jgi:cytochrome P450 family 6